TGVAAQEGRDGGVVAIAIKDGIAMVVVDRAGDIRLSVADAEEQRGAEFARVFVGRVTVFDARFGSVIVVVALDVHYSRDGICAVGRGGAILQNLDAFDRRLRDRIEIDEHDARVARGVRRDTTA